jgi:hypothetical protein
MIKLKEAQKTGTTIKDSAGRLVTQASFLFRDLFINPDHIISINEEITNDPGVLLTRVETLRGSFIVSGTPDEIQKQLSKQKKLLKD